MRSTVLLATGEYKDFILIRETNMYLDKTPVNSVNAAMEVCATQK